MKIAKEIGEHLDTAIRADDYPISEVTAFIISATPFAELTRKHGAGWTLELYAKHHILFQEKIEDLPALSGLLAAPVPAALAMPRRRNAASR